MSVPVEVIDEVATQVVQAYVKRGCRTDPEDIYQDAAEVAQLAAPGFDPTFGNTSLQKYLYHACWRKLRDRITRMAQPAGTRSNDEVKHLRNLQRVVLRGVHIGPDPVDYDEVVYRTQVRERMVALADTVPEGRTALAIVLDLTSVAEVANGDPARTKRLYYCVRRMKKALREDDTLARMAQDHE